ncbi:putative diguanylate cyclase YdaM [compost metagenome]
MGGDEFVIVLPQTPLDEALEVAARLRQVMEKVEPVGECRLTMSYGVVQWQEGDAPDDLLARADKALYRAKGAGKNAIADDLTALAEQHGSC